IAEADVDVHVENITPLCEPGSVRAAAPPGGRSIVSVQSALCVPTETATVGPSTAKVHELNARLARLQAEMERLGQRRQKLAKLFPDPALRTTSLIERVDARIRDGLATSELVHQVQQEVDQQLAALERDTRALQLELAAAELAHSQAPSSER